MALEAAVDQSLSHQEVMDSINEDPTIQKISRISAIVNTVKTALTSIYQLVKTARLVAEMNPYLVLSLSIYSGYRILRYFIWRPLSSLVSFLLLRSRRLSDLKIAYDLNSAVQIFTTLKQLSNLDSP